MSKDAKRNLRNVMAFVMADREVNPDEQRFIKSLQDRLDISDAELREIIAAVKAAPGKIMMPRDPAAADETVRMLEEAAVADGQISARERRALDRLKQAARSRADSAEAAKAAREIEAATEEVYRHFNAWDAPVRAEKIAAIGAYGGDAVVPLLKTLESYRTPEGSADALEMKALVAEQLGSLNDQRATYYLAQQVSIGDVDDEVTSAALRFAAAGALGQLTGLGFTADQDGVDAVRKWWFATGSKQYETLAY